MFYIHGLLTCRVMETSGGWGWGLRKANIPFKTTLACSYRVTKDIATFLLLAGISRGDKGFHSFLVLYTTKEARAQLSQFNILRWEATNATMPTYFPPRHTGVISYFGMIPLTRCGAPCREICLSAGFTGLECPTVQTHVSHPPPTSSPTARGPQSPMHDHLHLITRCKTNAVQGGSVHESNSCVQSVCEPLAYSAVCIGDTTCGHQ